MERVPATTTTPIAPTESQPVASTSSAGGGAIGGNLQAPVTPQRAVDKMMVTGYTNKSLIQAASNGDTQAVELLIEAGANIDQADEDGKTPLYWAARNGQTQVVKLLIEAGANIDQADKDGETPFSILRTKYNDEQIQKFVVLKPDQPYERGFPGYLSLQNICRQSIRGLFNCSGRIDELLLPETIKDYLKCKNV